MQPLVLMCLYHLVIVHIPRLIISNLQRTNKSRSVIIFRAENNLSGVFSQNNSSKKKAKLFIYDIRTTSLGFKKHSKNCNWYKFSGVFSNRFVKMRSGCIEKF